MATATKNKTSIAVPVTLPQIAEALRKLSEKDIETIALLLDKKAMRIIGASAKQARQRNLHRLIIDLFNMKMWRVFVTPAADRVIRKLPKECSRFVLEKFPPKVKADPFIGEQLTGPLAWLRSFHFSILGKPYRIAYGVDPARAK